MRKTAKVSNFILCLCLLILTCVLYCIRHQLWLKARGKRAWDTLRFEPPGKFFFFSSLFNIILIKLLFTDMTTNWTRDIVDVSWAIFQQRVGLGWQERVVDEQELEMHCFLGSRYIFLFIYLTIMFTNDYIGVNYTTNGDRRPPSPPLWQTAKHRPKQCKMCCLGQ